MTDKGAVGELKEAGYELNIEWEIANVFSLSAELEKGHNSPVFYFLDTAWYLRIYLGGQSKNKSEGYIGVFVVKRDSGPPISAAYKLSFKTADGAKEEMTEYVGTFKTEHHGWGVPKALPRASLLERKSELTPYGVLTVLCSLKHDDTHVFGRPKYFTAEYLHLRKVNLPNRVLVTDEGAVGELKETGHELIIEWEIANIWSLSAEVDKIHNSPVFYFLDAAWYLRMYLEGKGKKKSEGYIGMFVVKRDSGPPISAAYKLYFKTEDGAKEEVAASKGTFKNEHHGWGVPKALLKSSLLERKSELAPFDFLTVLCSLKHDGVYVVGREKKQYSKIHASTQTELELVGGEEPKEVEANPDADEQEAPLTESALASCVDYIGMILLGLPCDATVKAKRLEFPVHRAVLRSCSPVFARIFDEDQEGVVRMEDCDADVVDQLLLFVYSRKLENLPSSRILPRLYCAADKYGLQDLKQLCVDSMKSSLSKDIVCDITRLATVHGESHLLQLATEFFARETEKILPTTEWQNFMKENTGVANQLLMDLIKLRPCKREGIVTNDLREMLYRKMVTLASHPNNRG